MMEVKERLHKQMKKRLRDAYNTRISDADKEKARRGASSEAVWAIGARIIARVWAIKAGTLHRGLVSWLEMPLRCKLRDWSRGRSVLVLVDVCRVVGEACGLRPQQEVLHGADAGVRHPGHRAQQGTSTTQTCSATPTEHTQLPYPHPL